MAALKWDEIGTRYFEYGVDRGVLYPYSMESHSYPKGVAWNGLVNATASPSGGETTPVYADNVKYGSTTSATTFGGTIEAYTYPDEFNAMNGIEELQTGVYINGQAKSIFGLSYRTMIGSDEKEDAGYIIHMIYGCHAKPSENSSGTVNESVEAKTMSWEYDSDGVVMEGKRPIFEMTVDSRTLTAEKLKKLEDALYGASAAEAKLPLPSEIQQIVGGV